MYGEEKIERIKREGGMYGKLTRSYTQKIKEKRNQSKYEKYGEKDGERQRDIGGIKQPARECVREKEK